jgi:hypothetical protein
VQLRDAIAKKSMRERDREITAPRVTSLRR